MNSAEGIGNLSDAGIGCRQPQQYAARGSHRCGSGFQAPERLRHGLGSRSFAQICKSRDLCAFELGIMTNESDTFALRLILKLIHPDHDAFLRLDGTLIRVCGILNLALNPAGLDRWKHASEPVDRFQVVRKPGVRFRRSWLRSRRTPPTGSTVFVTPDSHAMICCVRSASRAASAVGSARASSLEFVCSDCAPPRTAASA